MAPNHLTGDLVMPKAPSLAALGHPQLSPKNIHLPPSPQSVDEDSVPPSPTSPSPPIINYDGTHATEPAIPISRATISLPYRPRTQSPSRSSSRPHTSLGVPLMQRAHSSPGVDSSGRFVASAPRRPTSPLHAGRRRSPLRSTVDDNYPSSTSSWSGLNIEPNIPENEELDLFPDDLPQGPLIPSYTNTFPRSRRRPTSPLYQSAGSPSLHAKSRSPSNSRSASPSFAAQVANEPYPGYSFSSASSMPSTPTSFRSRSPSISSLETIEDTPDAEEAALMAEEEAKQRTDENDNADSRRMRSVEIRASNLRSNKERKRWSVCGAERRADFSLEPIEE